jgi:hypothetical protein
MHGPSQTGPTEAFGREFRALMIRLTEKYGSLAGATDDPDGQARLRSDVAAEFAQEAEELIARHVVADDVAEYVRHVVREGFDVDYDPMDPTDVSLDAQARPPGPASGRRPRRPGSEPAP